MERPSYIPKWPITQPTGAPENADVTNSQRRRKQYPPVSHGRRRVTAVQAESCLLPATLCWLCWSDEGILINFTCRQAIMHHYRRPSARHFTLILPVKTHFSWQLCALSRPLVDNFVYRLVILRLIQRLNNHICHTFDSLSPFLSLFLLSCN